MPEKNVNREKSADAPKWPGTFKNHVNPLYYSIYAHYCFFTINFRVIAYYVSRGK